LANAASNPTFAYDRELVGDHFNLKPPQSEGSESITNPQLVMIYMKWVGDQSYFFPLAAEPY